MNTGIYVRVSTEEQAREGFSIRAQEGKLRDYARVKDWNVVDMYADEGISGKNIEDRPAMKQLIADIMSKKINNVLVYKVDRFTRSTKNLIDLIELLNENQCAFNSLMESIDTDSATGRMFLKIVGIFAEFERENMIERVKLGFERKVKEGYSLCSFTPSYGYRRMRGNRIQEVDRKEAVIVNRIFTMFLFDHYSCVQIADVLNAENIPTKRGRKWGAKGIKLVLSNPNYIGKVRYSCKNANQYFESDGKHESIINEDIFYKVQEKIGTLRKITKTKRSGANVYFCGVLYCSVCGGRLSTKWNYKKSKTTQDNKGVFPSYRCVNPLCKASTLSHLKLEKVFGEYLTSIEDFTELDNGLLDISSEEEQSELVEIESELQKVENKKAEIKARFLTSEIDFSTYQDFYKDVDKRWNALHWRAEKIQKNQVQMSSMNLKQNWDALTPNERQAFIQTFVNKIVVKNEKIENIHLGTLHIDLVEFHLF